MTASDREQALRDKAPDSAGPVIEFWYDFASTYSYLSAFALEATEAVAGIGLCWRPFLLGPIFAAQGWRDSPFNIYPAKGAYMWRDMERLCAQHALPWCRPTIFPQNSIAAARLALALDPVDLPAFTRAVFAANFGASQDIADPTLLSHILGKLGLPADMLMARSQTPEIKQLLRSQTERAQKLGIFGAPFFVVGEELFWGSDRLDQALGAYRGLAAMGRKA